MKLPKKTTRYCPFCKKKTEQKISIVTTGGKRGSLKKGSLARAKKRNLNRGMGSQGRYSKPPVSKWKRKTKSTKRNVVLYTCKECKKSKQIKKSIRTAKLQLE